MAEIIKAWHFGAEDGCLNYGKRRKVVLGKWMRAIGPLEMCVNGMHASIDPFDALQYAQGPLLSRVLCCGNIQQQSNKLVCRERKHLWQYDASKELRLFACKCVRETPLKDGRKVWDLLKDKRSRNVVVVAEKFAAGRATLQELAAAWATARATAWDAAWDAARATAWDAVWAWQRKEFARVIADIEAKAGDADAS